MPRLAGFPADFTIRFDGEDVPARAGEPVAAALLAAGRPLLSRSPKYHRPRGPFCLAGSCGGCLVRADGLPSRRACRTPCRAGLEAASQNAFPEARRDLLGAIDLATPRGIDHHRLATWSAVANRAAVALSRRLAGLGRLPGAFPAGGAAPREERVDALVVGAGPAGLAAAEALAEAGRRVLLAEQERAPGGRLRGGLGGAGEPELRWADAAVARVRAAGGEVALGAEVVGLWHDGGEPLALLAEEGRPAPLRLVRAARIVLCAGGHPEPPAVAGGDRPGVLAARGAAALLAEHGVVPGARAAVIGGDEAARLAERLGEAGSPAEVVAPAEVSRIVGGRRVRAIVAAGRRVSCDVVLVATPPAPATELARALGAPVRLDPAFAAFAVAADRDGRTGVPGLLAAGEVTGAADVSRAAEAGRRAGEAARG
jgi:sarcosine oxidase subunit alpha